MAGLGAMVGTGGKAGGGAMSEEDEVVFQDRDVRITRRAAMFGKVSYPIGAIGGVFVRAPKTGSLMVMAFLLLVFAIFNAHGQLAIPAFIVAVVIMVSSYLRPSRLVLRVAEGDRQALESRDRRRLRAIKAAIERAAAPASREYAP